MKIYLAFLQHPKIMNFKFSTKYSFRVLHYFFNTDLCQTNDCPLPVFLIAKWILFSLIPVQNILTTSKKILAPTHRLGPSLTGARK